MSHTAEKLLVRIVKKTGKTEIAIPLRFLKAGAKTQNI